jgi:cytochrome P450
VTFGFLDSSFRMPMELISPAAGATSRRMSIPHFLWKRRNLLGFLEEVGHWNGDRAEIKIGSQTITVVKHPDLIQQLLVGHAGMTSKGRSAERKRFFAFLGDGLLNSEGEPHRRQRRLVLPAFHRSRLGSYGDKIRSATEEMAAPWRPEETRDIGADMMALTLTVVGRTLFSSAEADGGAGAAIAHGFNDMVGHLNRLIFPGATWLLRSPLPFAQRIRRAQATLDEAVYRLIAERRKAATDTGDLLSTLLLAEDADRPGERLADSEIRDQVMTLFFAGQETTANALTWIWWLLATHPTAEAALQAELGAVLGSREVGFADVAQLPYTSQIVTEALRLYPPVWTMGRQALADLDLGGQIAPQGSLILAPQWLLHRDPRWFPQPETFRPERWTSEFRSALPRFAYFPFGGGARSCIGENLAWTEIVLVVATLARRWRFRPMGDTASVRPFPRITLCPDRPVRLKLTAIDSRP